MSRDDSGNGSLPQLVYTPPTIQSVEHEIQGIKDSLEQCRLRQIRLTGTLRFKENLLRRLKAAATNTSGGSSPPGQQTSAPPPPTNTSGSSSPPGQQPGAPGSTSNTSGPSVPPGLPPRAPGSTANTSGPSVPPGLPPGAPGSTANTSGPSVPPGLPPGAPGSTANTSGGFSPPGHQTSAPPSPTNTSGSSSPPGLPPGAPGSTANTSGPSVPPGLPPGAPGSTANTSGPSVPPGLPPRAPGSTANTSGGFSSPGLPPGAPGSTSNTSGPSVPPGLPPGAPGSTANTSGGFSPPGQQTSAPPSPTNTSGGSSSPGLPPGAPGSTSNTSGPSVPPGLPPGAPGSTSNTSGPSVAPGQPAVSSNGGLRPVRPANIPPPPARRRQLSTMSFTAAVFDSPVPHVCYHNDEDNYSVPINRFAHNLPAEALRDPYRMSAELVMKRWEAVESGALGQVSRGDKIRIMGFKFESPRQVREWLRPNTKDDVAKWEFIQMRPIPLEEYPAGRVTYNVQFEATVENTSSLSFATQLSTWKERFCYVSLSADRPFIWHGIRNSEILRLMLLATHLEEHHELYMHYPSDWRHAVTQIDYILEAWSDRKTRHKVTLLLTEKGKDRLRKEVQMMQDWKARNEAATAATTAPSSSTSGSAR